MEDIFACILSSTTTKLLGNTLTFLAEKPFSRIAFCLRFSKATNASRVPKDQPRLFVGISGEATLSLSTRYRLQVELSYPTEHHSRAITFNRYHNPIDSAGGIQCTFKFLKDGMVAPEYPMDVCKPDIRPRQVSDENGFSSIRPGETITTSTMIDASTYELEIGEQYQIQLPWGPISLWAFGGMEVGVPASNASVANTSESAGI